MISSRSVKYARSLAEVAAESKEAGRVGQELEALGQLLDSHAELKSTLVNPIIPFRAKRAILEQIVREAGFLSLVGNFLLVLVQSAQIEQFEEVQRAYRAVLDEMEGIVRADVFSARELQEPEVRRLEEAIGGFTGRQAKVSHHLDESLLGGVKVRIGSTVYDGSVSAQLKAIRHEFGSG